MVTIVFSGLRVLSVYIPICGANEDSLERYRRDEGRQLACERESRLVKGWDFNMNLGKENAG